MDDTPPACRIDHLVVVAGTLDAGCDHVEQAIGVRPAGGGVHARMGTHNRLLSLGPSVYLEVIAIDPAAPHPGRPRWFGLDERSPHDPPHLATWAARTTTLDASLAAAREPLGAAEPMSRGDLHWRIAIPPDGALLLGGPAPTLIEWARPEDHPAGRLPDSGCRLVALGLRHPQPARLQALLGRLGFDPGPVRWSVDEASRPGLTAQIQTPAGLRTLGG